MAHPSSAASRMSTQLPLRLLFFGPPGVGKGTYASNLSSAWAIPHISTGDVIREEIKSGSQLGKRFLSFSSTGALVPDELVLDIARARLSQPDAQGGYILDGFPRTVAQAQQLKSISNPSLCVNFHLPTSLLTLKLSGRRVCNDCGRNYNVADIREGVYDMPPLLPKPEDCERCKGQPNLVQRQDDREDVVAQRLRTYDADTAPLIDFYTNLGILVTFNVKKGIGDLPEITDTILQELQKK